MLRIVWHMTPLVRKWNMLTNHVQLVWYVQHTCIEVEKFDGIC